MYNLKVIYKYWSRGFNKCRFKKITIKKYGMRYGIKMMIFHLDKLVLSYHLQYTVTVITLSFSLLYTFFYNNLASSSVFFCLVSTKLAPPPPDLTDSFFDSRTSRPVLIRRRALQYARIRSLPQDISLPASHDTSPHKWRYAHS